METNACCTFDDEKLRVILRGEAERAAQLSSASLLAVAQAVKDWYLAEYPHLGVMGNQPDLENIVMRLKP